MVAKDALNATECLPVLEETDREPTLKELNEALNSLASGKVPGIDGIPKEVLKCCKEDINTELHELLFKILSKNGCLPKLISIISFFHGNMKGTVVFDG